MGVFNWLASLDKTVWISFFALAGSAFTIIKARWERRDRVTGADWTRLRDLVDEYAEDATLARKETEDCKTSLNAVIAREQKLMMNEFQLVHENVQFKVRIEQLEKRVAEQEIIIGELRMRLSERR